MPGLTQVSGLSDDGLWVPGADIREFPDPGDNEHIAVLYDVLGARIQRLSGVVYIETEVATAVSADGSIAVGYENGPSGQEPLMWGAGVALPPGLPPSYRDSRALDISPDGSYVVGGRYDAFIWDVTNGMRAVADLVTAAGIDLTGWSLEAATAVSADGETIVGYGTNPAGDPEGWLFSLPEPGTGLLIGVALLASLRPGRRRS